jgi:hypothetical protein
VSELAEAQRPMNLRFWMVAEALAENACARMLNTIVS